VIGAACPEMGHAERLLESATGHKDHQQIFRADLSNNLVRDPTG